MSKNFVCFLIFFSFLKVSYQIDCDDFSDATCGGHNTNYILKCHQFTTNAACVEVEVDDGCNINDQHNCVKTDQSSTSYQCYFTDNTNKKCKKVNIDDKCEINSSKICDKKSGVTLDANKKCLLINGGKDCKLQDKVCYDYNSDCNTHGENCVKINGFSTCSIATVDAKCEINASGNCVDKANGGIGDYEKCGFDDYYTECKPINKACSDMAADKCAQCRSSPTGYTCSKVGGACKNVKIDSSCKIDNEQCVKTSTNTDKNVCKFKNGNTECKFYEVNTNCKLTESTGVLSCDNDGLTDDKQKCAFIDNDQTKCQPRATVCSDYTTNCESTSLATNKKCSVYSGYYCREYTVDEYCTVKAGKCERKSGVAADQFGTTQECLFDKDEKSCTRKTKECKNYYSNCRSHDTDTISCLYKNNDYCLPITLDGNCKVDEDGDCTNKKTIDNSKICSFDSDTEPTICKMRDKECKDYETSSTCNAVSNCIFRDYFNHCYKYEVETNNCAVKSSKCETKEGVTLDVHKQCAFDYPLDFDETAKCKTRNKICSDYGNDSANCNKSPKTEYSQCHYFSSCKTISIDGNCYVDNDGKCVEDGSGKLSSYEECAFTDDSKAICRKREKSCTDYKESTCGNFTPETKLCFKIGSSSYCKEVKVDSQCNMNEDNECTGNNCQFDDKKDRCYYQEKSSGSLLKMKQFILLMIFFMF